LAVAAKRLSHLFPRLPQQPGYSKRRRRLADTLEWLMGIFAGQSPGSADDLLLIDSTPVECARSRETVKRSALGDAADYGWCSSHSRYFWGFRLHGIFAADGTPRALQLTSPKVDEREVALVLLDRCQRRGGETLLGDKGYAGRDFAAAVTVRDATIVRPRRKDEPAGGPHLAPLRQRIESIFWTCKDLLTLGPLRPHPARIQRTHPSALLLPGRRDHPQPPTRTPQPCPRQLLRLTAWNQPSR
jgi:transposase